MHNSNKLRSLRSQPRFTPVASLNYSFVVSYILYWVTDKMVNMRVNVKHEQLGLDRSQHGESYGILYEDEEHEIREVAMGAQAHAK